MSEYILPGDVFSIIGEYLSNGQFAATFEAFDNDQSTEMLGLLHSIPRFDNYIGGLRIRITSEGDMVRFRLRKEEMRTIRGLWIFIDPSVVPLPLEFEDFHMDRISFIGTTIDNVIVYGDNIEDGRRMFNRCIELTRIDFMTLNKLTNGERMFCECIELSSLPVMTLNELTYGGFMFDECSVLSTLQAMTLNQLTDGRYMFHKCFAISNLPDMMTLHNLTNGDHMFYQCSELSSLPDMMELNNLTNGNHMFSGCISLKRQWNSYVESGQRL